jgi:6-pyruvoyl-tetrahydropterin synthase
MHVTDDCIVMLLEKGWVRDFFSKIKSKGKAILKHLDLSFINDFYNEIKDTNRGRPPDYQPEEKLKGVLYCLASGVRKIRGMSRKLKETLATLICGFQDGTPSAPTLSRFFHFLSSVIEKIFHHLVAFAARLGIYGDTFLIDTTSIEVFEDDPDAKWNYDATSKSWYYGYGLELIVDWKTHLPVAGVFTNGKHVGDSEIEEGLNRMYAVKSPNVFAGDGEFDTKNTHNILLNRRTLPVMKYNPRNTKKQTTFSFRIEEIVNETSNGKVHLNTNLLKQDYKKRIEVEHSISTIKSLGLEYPQVRGYNAVKTHTFLILICRLAIGVYKNMEKPDANLREVNIEL